MKNNRDKLLALFKDDPLGLLDQGAVAVGKNDAESQRWIDQFQEIVSFYESTGKKPSLESDDIHEFTLASRLQALKNSPERVKQLLPYDMYNLLDSTTTKTFTIDDVLTDDPLGLLDISNEDSSIFKLEHVNPTKRIRPDYVARRRVCKNFEQYESGFAAIKADFSEGRRKLIKFTDMRDLEAGKYYVLRGVIFYLERDESELTSKTYNGETYRRKNGRTHCVFDNGTESSLLFRSLTSAMYEDGYLISDVKDPTRNKTSIEDSDVQNGYIYVLKSLSDNPQVQQTKNLYKIGRCSGPVTLRIQNAAHDPTYLMSDVEVVLTVRCYNLNVNEFEATMHQFFGECNVQFQVQDTQGKTHFPREWFVAPLSVIEEAIQYFVDGSIASYRYDKKLGVITKVVDSSSGEASTMTNTFTQSDEYTIAPEQEAWQEAAHKPTDGYTAE